MNTRLTIVAAIAFAALGYTGAAQAQSLDNWGPSTGGSLVTNIPSSDFQGHMLPPGSGPGIVDNTCNYHLDMQSDGNLVEYFGPGESPSNAVWATATDSQASTSCAGWPCFYTIFQSDGNLVMYNSSNSAVVYSHNSSGDTIPSGTNGARGDWFFVNNTGQMIIGGPSGNLWVSANNNGVHGRGTVSPCVPFAGTIAYFTGAHNSGTSMQDFSFAPDSSLEGASGCATYCELNAPGPNLPPLPSQCAGFNFNDSNQHCQLLSTNGPFTRWSGMESGYKEALE
jgi:hypothetical protein